MSRSPEEERLHLLTQYEREATTSGFNCIAGIDEAGRGPLAGPVVAAAIILPSALLIPGINDSKKLSPKLRKQLFEQLIRSAIDYAVGVVDAVEIDRINIYQATIIAMLSAVAKLKIVPDCLFVDGMALPHPAIPSKKIIRGDQLSQTIAAASIIAKETRDALMVEYHAQWPHYGFDRHKGYGTEMHLEALERLGPCPIHRMSFKPVGAIKSAG